MNNFAEACRLSYLEWEANLPNIENLPDPKYSKGHIKKIDRLFDKMREGYYHRFTGRAIKGMLIAAVILALALIACATPSSREFFVEEYKEFTRFTMTQGNKNDVTSIEIGFIPEGFEITKTYENPNDFGYEYETADGKFLAISKYPSGGYTAVNSEGGKTEEVTIGNTTYFVITNLTGFYHVIWTDNDYIYCVGGNLPTEELLKIAQALK